MASTTLHRLTAFKTSAKTTHASNICCENDAMASTDEPIVSRLDRLDLMLRHLEEMRGYNRSSRSSYASTPSSGVLTSDGGNSSVNSSPKSLEKHCRPIDEVLMETQVKGTLIDRLVQVENHVLMLCLQLEEEKEGKKTKEGEKKEHKKGLKQMVKSCMRGNSKAKSHSS